MGFYLIQKFKGFQGRLSYVIARGKIKPPTAVFAVLDMLKHLIDYLDYEMKSALLEVCKDSCLSKNVSR